MKMKKILASGLVLASILTLVSCSNSSSSGSSNSKPSAAQTVTTEGKSILFINASQHTEGNTAQMGATLLEGVDHDTLNLVDYRINQLGQNFEGDQFNDIISAMEKADTIVIGTPVYWHTMSGSLKTLIDRFYDLQGNNTLQGKKLYFFMQGSAPTEEAINQTEFIMTRVAQQTGMDLVGMADNNQEIADLHSQLVN